MKIVNILAPKLMIKTLLDRLEELEDINDILKAQKEPGRPFEEYLKERTYKRRSDLIK